jgi:hypothetical protein
MTENKSARIQEAIKLLAENEIDTLKKAFAENEELLMSIRRLLFGFPIKKSEADVIESTFKDKNVRDAFKNKLYLELSPTTPIGQGADYWFGTDTEIVGKDPDTINQIVTSKHLVLMYLERGMAALENYALYASKINLELSSIKDDPFQIMLLARNKYVSTVNTALIMIKTIAGMKNETAKETKERLIMANSNK